MDVKSNFASLLSILDIFNLDKDSLSELEDYLKVIGYFIRIYKFGLSKKHKG